jgi:CRP-like cAMP-binding protein
MAHPPHSSNHILASLSAGHLAALIQHLDVIELPQETVLYETGDSIKAVYFPHSGLVSLVVDLASGEMIEAAMIGSEGVVGGAAASDNRISLNRAVVQVAANASVLDVERFWEVVEQSAAIRATLARHEQYLLAQAQQSAACNATHTLEARLARWLLRCRDVLESNDIALTQEFLADMLGVRRTTVTLAAHALQQAGLIQYRRGHIRLANLEGLQDSACECYATIKGHADRLLGSSPPD